MRLLCVLLLFCLFFFRPHFSRKLCCTSNSHEIVQPEIDWRYVHSLSFTYLNTFHSECVGIVFVIFFCNSFELIVWIVVWFGGYDDSFHFHSFPQHIHEKDDFNRSSSTLGHGCSQLQLWSLCFFFWWFHCPEAIILLFADFNELTITNFEVKKNNNKKTPYKSTTLRRLGIMEFCVFFFFRQNLQCKCFTEGVSSRAKYGFHFGFEELFTLTTWNECFIFSP